MRTVSVIALLVVAAACSSAANETPALTPESEAELSARGLALLCDQHCIGEVVYVSDHEYETVSPPAPGDALSETQQSAIKKQFTDVEFVTDELAQAAHDQGVFIFVVGPISEEASGLVRVEVERGGTRRHLHGSVSIQLGW